MQPEWWHVILATVTLIGGAFIWGHRIYSKSIEDLDERLRNFELRVAQDYISREVMQEVEHRMAGAIGDLGRTLAESIDRLHGRVDNILTPDRHRVVQR